MALRLRRGTDAERLTITPLEGELIYTTDTEKLYIGDGSTVGGNPVDSDSITDELSDLTDVDTTGVQDGDTLVYNLSNTRFEPGSQATAIGDLTDVDTSSVSTGDVLKWNGVNFVPGAEAGFTEGATYPININGDISGSVFADDSTLLVDGISGSILANSFAPANNQLVIGTEADETTCKITVNTVGEEAEKFSHLELVRKSDTDLSTSNINYGLISFNRDDSNGFQQTSFIGGREDKIVFASTPTGDVFNAANYFGWSDQKLGIGTITPTNTLDVRGEIVAQSYVQFGSLTTTERDALTAANGMVIYNTTDNKFQGYENGAWVNLI